VEKNAVRAAIGACGIAGGWPSGAALSSNDDRRGEKL
jgi:hypothetical protein